MTQEERIFIVPQDIIAIGCECSHCKSTFVVPVEKIDRVLAKCPNCNERLISETQPSSGALSESTVFLNFVTWLKSLQARDFGGNIRLEIKGEVKPSA